MTPTRRTPVFVLSCHAPYACGRSGVCCASGWDIPVDAAEQRAIGNAVDRRLVLPARYDDDAGPPPAWFREAPELPSPGVAVLARQASGDCVFLDRSDTARCLVQAACGHPAMPMACQQFPRVSMADDRGLHVTLSHYCPSVADLLWRDDNRLVEVLEDPPGWSASRLIAGLDARGHWPPLLRPGVLMSLEAWSRWERLCVAAWARSGTTAATGLAAIARAADALAGWTRADGPVEGALDRVLAAVSAGPRPVVGPFDTQAALLDWRTAWDCVPRGRAPRPQEPVVPAIQVVGASLDAERVAVTRYLAAKCVGSWAAYQGHGLRSFVASVRLAAHVLLVEMARGAEAEPRDRVREAIRRSDLLLVHLAESTALATAWNLSERQARVCNRTGFRES